MNNVKEKFKDLRIKFDIVNFIGESIQNYMKKTLPPREPISLLEFSNIFCYHTIKEYGLLADVVLEHWGIKNLKDLSYILKEIVREKKERIALDIPSGSPDDFFMLLLNPENIGLIPYQRNGNLNIGYSLGNGLKIS